MKVTRSIQSKILSELTTGTKGIVLYGSRQVGKTTLVNEIINKLQLKVLMINGDERGDWWNLLTSRELTKIKLLVTGYDAIFIDEAQRIPEIGLSLKIILDNFPKLKVIVTGSSSLDLASKISEPLTGRIYTYRLYPISCLELVQHYTPLEMQSQLEERLIFGSYPELFSIDSYTKRIEYLKNLTNAYLYKDLFEFGEIRNSGKIYSLLKLLGFQIGSQVSMTELASSLEISRTTVERYVELLEKSFIIFRLGGFSRNLRKEVTKMDKIYFWDLGVRNAMIGNLNLLKDRDDAGRLWENYLIVERIKQQEYLSKLGSHYYWRLSSGAELDLVEENEGKLSGFEFKYSEKDVKAPLSWISHYPDSDFRTINKTNWIEFTS